MAHTTELDDRIAKCNKILSSNPNSQIFAALAEAHRKKGEVDKAFRICQNGLRIHPDYGSAHLVMGKINLDKGLYDWAEMETQKAIELDGHALATDLLLAEIYIYKGEIVKAIKDLEKLHLQDQHNQQITKLLELARKIQRETPDKNEPPPQPRPDEIAEPAPAPIEEKEEPLDDRLSIADLMDQIIALKGIEGILFINKEGLVAENRWHDEQDPELYGAMAKEIEKLIQSQIELSKFGDYDNILLEADNFMVSFLPLGDNLLLVKGNKQANLGTLRMKLNSLLSQLADEYK